MFRQKSLFATLALLSLSTLASAQPMTRAIVAPTCLLQQMQGPYTSLAKANNLELIQIDDQGLSHLISAKSQRQMTPCGGFMDVTEDWQHTSLSPKAFLKTYLPTNTRGKSTSYSIKYEKQVTPLLSEINQENMKANLTTLSSFNDRYANSDTGVKAAEWIKNKVETMARDYNRQDVTVYTVATGSYKQPSVVAKFGNGTGPGIVVGGHMDTLRADMFGAKPGADDDGSGTVTILEAVRTLFASGMNFKKPIYFIWYSAEELGLYGSQYVVADFKKKNIPVDAVVQFDMTGYENPKDPKTMWLMTDYVNKDLTGFMQTLITTYVKQPVKLSRCGYACSDHASWTQKGYAAAMPFETEMNKDNPNIHTSNDQIQHLNFNHMQDYAKLATAYAVELAEPTA